MDSSSNVSIRATRRLAPLVIALLLAPVAPAQQAGISESSQVFRTYPFSDPDPVARFGNIYPYFRFHGYSKQPVKRSWKIVTLENPYIRVLVAPEIGGKVLGAFEKTTGRAFIYFNRVVKFRDIAMRGPWTSGGIEFNFGDIGHTPTTATPVDYVTRKNPDGSVSCIIGALDLPSRTEWRVEIRVPADGALFETRAFWSNPTELPTSLYQWTTAAGDADSTLRVIYPGSASIGHAGETAAWPAGPGNRDLSSYKANAFGSYKSYHVLGMYTDYFGLQWGNFGVIHWSPYADKPGKKLWIWGLSREGEIWKDLLTDPELGNRQYVEFQSGFHFNQALPASSRTPFKHMQFLPATSERFTETWMPFRNLGGVTKATPDGMLYVRSTAGRIRYTFSPTRAFAGNLSVRVQGNPASTRTVSLLPLQAYEDSIPVADSRSRFEILVGTLMRYRSTDDSSRLLARPVVSEKPFDWNSAYGLSIDAQERARQRDYDGALASYRRSLEKEPAYLPALSGAAEMMYRSREDSSSFAYARSALAVDAYDPAANYFYGLSAQRLGRMYDARDGFSIAARSHEYRLAAYLQLAELALADNNRNEAEEFAQRCIADDGGSVGARRLLAILYRQRGDTAGAIRNLEAMSATDPLNHFADFERYLLTHSPESRRAFTDAIRNELAQETFIELGAIYTRLGMLEDAAEVLQLSPPSVMVELWRAAIASMRGRESESRALLQKAVSASPFLVFPHRAEETDILLWAERQTPHWKVSYYLGLLWAHLGRRDKALAALLACGDIPDYVPLYLTRASLRAETPDSALADYRKALAAGPGEWRAHKALIDYFNERALYHDALPLSRAAAKRFPGNDNMQFLLARTYLFNKQYASSLDILDTLTMLPSEGARSGRDAYRQACILTALSKRAPGGRTSALNLVARARLWPERLGAGEPYNADTRIEDYLTARFAGDAGDTSRRREYLTRITDYTSEHPSSDNAQQLIGAFAYRDLGNPTQAIRLLEDWSHREPESPAARWALTVYRNGRQAARTIEENLRSAILDRGHGDQDFVLMVDVVDMLPAK